MVQIIRKYRISLSDTDYKRVKEVIKAYESREDRPSENRWIISLSQDDYAKAVSDLQTFINKHKNDKYFDWLVRSIMDNVKVW